jgi:5,10-methylenetetrahydromethanopterin reductase
LILVWDDLAAFQRRLRLADQLGYDLIGVGDSPKVYRELYVALAIAAHETSRARIGSVVTTPKLRHPLITAAAIGSINALSGGRAFLGVGRGGSAADAAQEPPAR